MKYNDKINYPSEDFDVIHLKTPNIKIDENYKYVHKNVFFKIFSFITYRLFATPIFWFYSKFIRRIKYVNRKILKKYKNGGYFIYGNHTYPLSDAISPSLITFPKKPSIIANKENLSTPVIGKFLPQWGILPLPENLEATKHFYYAIENTLKHNNPVVIYPEAHLWPYYTNIRNFSNVSFRYPVKYNKPVFTFTTTYTKPKKIGKKPKITIYIDGPFFTDTTLPIKDAQEKLRQEVYDTMVIRSKSSDYEYYQYERSNND